MSIFRTIRDTIIEALFPLSRAEKELFSLSPERALNVLPAAPTVPIGNAISIFAYKDERVAKLVWNIKYKKSKQAVEIGGYALWWVLGEIGSLRHGFEPRNREKPERSDLFTIIPMPITPRRRKERGFNQCELLVDEIARLDREGRFTIEKELLRRVHHASRQTLKDRKDRLESAKGIFAVDEETAARYRDPTSPYRGEVGSRSVIIIDDVITTGSTMKEAIETLKDAGFTRVTGLSLAH